MYTKNVKILVVDDVDVNIVLLKGIVKKLNVEVLTASCGDDAVQTVKDNREHLAAIIMDVVMPVKDGYETAREIRENPGLRNIPIIFVTALSKDVEYEFKGYDAGAVDFLFKPFNARILLSKLQVFIQLFQQKHKIMEQQDRLLEESKLEAIVEMGVAIAHEFSQPLSVISGYVEMMANSVSEGDANYAKYNKILKNIEKLSQLIKKVRNITDYKLLSYIDKSSMVDIRGVDFDNKKTE